VSDRSGRVLRFGVGGHNRLGPVDRVRSSTTGERKRRSGGDAPTCVVDPERVGALLDGKLTGPDREAALGEIAVSDDDSCVFADTAAVLRETEEEPPTSTHGLA
jgi:hypothetical protein